MPSISGGRQRISAKSIFAPISSILPRSRCPQPRPTYAALRFIYRQTLGKDWKILTAPWPKEERRLPVVLSLGAVAKFFDALTSIKHRAILMTIYAAGLRASEVVKLKKIDIDSERMQIRVRQGKGRKDRYVMLSPALLTILREYWRLERPAGGEWLFPGSEPARPICTGTVRQVCRKAARSCLKKRVSLHTFRHYADCRVMPSAAR